MPAFGLGTWKSKPKEVSAAVEAAVRMGYRHIDCAAIYANEDEVGEGLRRCFEDGVVRREDLWITSKLWNDCHGRDEVVPALRGSLERLGLDYLDLYLIHWPVAHRHGVLYPKTHDDQIPLATLPLATTWAGMEDAKAAGLSRHIGVSNVHAARLEALLDAAERVQPEVNQVELHPYLPQNALVELCKRRGVVVTAYSPLGSGDRNAALRKPDEPKLLADPVVAAVGERRGLSPAQVLIRWALDRETVVIPKSVTPEYLRQNLAAARAEPLSAEDMQALADLGETQRRYVLGDFWALPGGSYSVADLWGE
ncbi:aldo/keto reductase [Pseudenhygromyxa sp. WMMC2535]|nr:aldo/keto reductase [Pseudenhygromyxa sp. WMMC2535]